MYKRVIIKVGTSVISEAGMLHYAVLEKLVYQIVQLHKNAVEVVLITSGAVAAGRELLVSNVSAGTTQVFASVGQIRLMSSYLELFNKEHIQCAQVLVTKSDFRDREHYANMKKNFEDLFRAGIVPVVNENDAIAIHEIGFSDNDELAALIAAQLNADAVVFLSNVDGVLADGNVVNEVEEKDVTALEKHISHERSAEGRGGMKSKFSLAKKLMGQGIAVYVANGRGPSTIVDIVEGKSVGTKFIPKGKLSAVKRRLAYTDGLSVGAVYVDKRAEEILISKKFVSLLSVGVTKVEGDFKKGDTIEIRNESGKKLGFGVAQYDAGKAEEAKGKKGGRALIHYDYMFIG